MKQQSYDDDLDGYLIVKTENGSNTLYTYTADNLLQTTTVNGVLEDSVVYDGSRLKAFELLRREYTASEVQENTKLQEEITQNQELLSDCETSLQSKDSTSQVVDYNTATIRKKIKRGNKYI